MYNALIIDDETLAREIIESHLSKIGGFSIVASCKNAAEGFSALSNFSVDIIFLDINMPEITGIMFAKAISEKTQIIFTTAYREYAVEGFELAALDYLLKPISLERMITAVERFKELNAVSKNKIEFDFTFFRCDRKMVKINFEDLLYAESFGDYIKLHTTSTTFITRETMKNVIQKLPESDFLRVHRSFVVAVSKIESYTTEYVTVENKAISISRSYSNAVQKVLEQI
ncbi:response regulator transcription factor [Rasiella rasia]|uniref:Response regulator transcription factor n=1 Tax=Rasiella rasia TaxID=2744027 RepID=A0A6G6GL06_9FLAO|nr:LytTR family DNA-binding domain-containing protein [Rasiella rasia]QIE59170.1 response regulator transcription factor [Rasiella rasia]